MSRPDFYTVLYAITGGGGPFTHSIIVNGLGGDKLAEATMRRDEFLRGGGNGITDGLYVWVEDRKGDVVYGEARP